MVAACTRASQATGVADAAASAGANDPTAIANATAMTTNAALFRVGERVYGRWTENKGQPDEEQVYYPAKIVDVAVDERDVPTTEAGTGAELEPRPGLVQVSEQPLSRQPGPQAHPLTKLTSQPSAALESFTAWE